MLHGTQDGREGGNDSLIAEYRFDDPCDMPGKRTIDLILEMV